MAIKSSLTWVFLFIFIISQAVSDDDRKLYIVYMGERPNGEFSAERLHINILEQVLGSGGSRSLLHSYHRSFNGFVAKLTHDDAHKLANLEGIVSVFPNQMKQLHTTRSWDFMGFSKNVTRTNLESDIIIGMLDTGIWPESKSFNDEGFGPPPKKWKGICQGSSNFTCNNKIIGARYYKADKNFHPTDIKSPRDSEGHGSHTSSIAAGALVQKASLSGLALGLARGGVPSARIAVYKICWADGCSDADILAAFDDAIADGVDIISLSVGGSFAVDYFNDSIAIGAFHSMKNGILTSNSAGNSGPQLASITNVSPWSLSVAASTIDRKIFTKVKLGNGEIYKGTSINTIELKHNMYPLIYGGDAPNTKKGYDSTQSRYCSGDSLDKALVKGKIVLCDSVNSGEGPSAAGAVGAIMQYYLDSAFNFPLPVSCLGSDDGTDVSTYLNTTRKPKAKILKSIEEKDEQAPYVISFSSRGPNPITYDILKPDLTAPGVDILAAWSQGTTITGYKGDNRVVPYNIISGTSMSCPHATAAAAYIKSFNPTWSPAAIKSALMTTAVPLSLETNTDAEFGFGSGHLVPSSALDPGLIYDAGEIDYVKFLCGQGYDTETVRLVTGDRSKCSDSINGTAWDLNYPSFALSATPGKSTRRVFHRTVMNVGSGVSIYKATVKTPPGLKIVVRPNLLGFKATGETKSFIVKVKAKIDGNNITNMMLSGSLIWDDGFHQDMLLGGTNTVVITLEWSMSHLLNKLNTLQKSKSELDFLIGHDRLLDETDLLRLHYLQNVISKTLRLNPVVPLLIPHISSDRCNLLGYNIPKGTMLLVNAWAIHRDPKVWDEATSFKLEMFEKGRAEGYKMMSFGFGRSACPGMDLGQRVVGLALGSLIQCFERKRVSSKKIDMAEGKGLNLPKAKPLEAFCKVRNTAKEPLS